MKTIWTAAAIAGLAIAGPALAQPGEGAMQPSVYGNLGYSNFDDNSDTSAVSGRLGVRVGKYLGVEGEGAVGFATGQTQRLAEPTMCG